jgi:hypothetical protein
MKVADKNKRKYSHTDLTEMFANIPQVTSNLIVNPEIRSLYKQKTGESDNSKELDKDEDGKVKRQSTNDICPICLDNLEDGDINDLDYCKYGCGKSIHKNCFNMWSKKNQRTCVFCRAKWEKEVPRNNNIENTGYINLTGNQGKTSNNYYYDKRKYKRNYWKRSRWYDYYDDSEDDEEDESEDERFDWSMEGYNNSYLNSASVSENSNFNGSDSSNNLSSRNNISNSLSHSSKTHSNNPVQYSNFSKDDFKSGFQIFLKLERENYSEQGMDNKEILKIVSSLWKELPPSEKESYDLIAKYGREEFITGHSINIGSKNDNDFPLSEEEKELDTDQGQIFRSDIRQQDKKNKVKVNKREKNYFKNIVIPEGNSSEEEDDREINIIKNMGNSKNKTTIRSRSKSNKKTTSNRGNVKPKNKKDLKKETKNKSRSRSRSKSVITVRSNRSTRSNTSLKYQPLSKEQGVKSKNSNISTSINKKQTARKTTDQNKKSYGKTKHVITKDKKDKRKKRARNEISKSENEGDSE